jgi:hypothetical protein
MHANDSKAVGLAALSICESLLLELVDRGTLGEEERQDILLDAADAHRILAERDDADGLHRRVASIIERIAAGAGGPMRAPDEAAGSDDGRGARPRPGGNGRVGEEGTQGDGRRRHTPRRG